LKLAFTICRDDKDFEVIAEVTYRKAHRGARDSLCGIRGAGPQLEPDEPAEIEIGTVTDAAGNEIDVDKKLEARIYEEANEAIENAKEDGF
jgi:hypothetical protein